MNGHVVLVCLDSMLFAESTNRSDPGPALGRDSMTSSPLMKLSLCRMLNKPRPSPFVVAVESRPTPPGGIAVRLGGRAGELTCKKASS
jgi:hypothetical protein